MIGEEVSSAGALEGTCAWPPGLTCRRFSLEPIAANSARASSRATSSSSHCTTSCTGTVMQAASSTRPWKPTRPSTALVIRGSLASRGTLMVAPSEKPTKPTEAGAWPLSVKASSTARHSGTASAAISAFSRATAATGAPPAIAARLAASCAERGRPP